MWISEAISGKGGSAPFTAAVSHSSSGKVTVGSSEGSGVAEQFLPYGIESVPPKGARAVVVPAGRTLCLCGVAPSADHELEAGEIALYSSGGASIILKNDGTVVINGTVFTGGE